MELEGKKIIILVEEMFNDLEFWYPFYRLKEAGAHVVVVGSGSAEAYSANQELRQRRMLLPIRFQPRNLMASSSRVDMRLIS